MSLAAEKIDFPDKLFYKIGEVSRIAGVEPYVLRYWETEFSFLKPRKSKAGQRVYLRKDVETILKIKTLLYEEKYTIAGVRQRLGGREPSVSPSEPLSPSDRLDRVKNTLQGLLRRLEKPL